MKRRRSAMGIASRTGPVAVEVDGSAEGLRVIDYACQMAQNAGADLLLVRPYSARAATLPLFEPGDVKAHAEAELRDAVARVRRQVGFSVTVGTALREGSRLHVLPQAARLALRLPGGGRTRRLEAVHGRPHRVRRGGRHRAVGRGGRVRVPGGVRARRPPGRRTRRHRPGAQARPGRAGGVGVERRAVGVGDAGRLRRAVPGGAGDPAGDRWPGDRGAGPVVAARRPAGARRARRAAAARPGDAAGTGGRGLPGRGGEALPHRGGAARRAAAGAQGRIGRRGPDILRTVTRVLPAWTRGYQRGWLRADALAGVTVAAYLVPQVMARSEE